MDNESDRTFSFSINDKDTDKRLDSFLASIIDDLSRSRVQELVKTGNVKVNDFGPKISYRLKTGDQVRLTIPFEPPVRLEPEPVQFKLIHEDQSLIIINKPPGLVIHPAPGHKRGTLVHGLLQQFGELSSAGGELRPGIVHRLDKDTSGILVVAKSDRAHKYLSKQFKAGTVNKRYLALVHGNIKGDEGEINQPIARHPIKRKAMAVVPSGGKKALTRWDLLDNFGDKFSLLSVTPKTGRTHQIRVHFSHAGHPILGDPLYGHKRKWWKKHLPAKMQDLLKIKRQMLHAETLGFLHPDSDSYCEFQASMPFDMDRILKELKYFYLNDGVQKT